MTTDFVTGEAGEEPAPGSVRDIPPVKLTLAGREYTFRCPKLTVWAEFAVPAASKVTAAGRTEAMVANMVMFLHAALSPADSEDLHQRKYDPDDDLDVPDLARAFTDLVARWKVPIDALARTAGMRLQLDPEATKPPAGRKATKAPAKGRPR